jgi:amidase
VQTRSVRDAAAMLDCLAVPQVGDPFVIPKPAESYLSLARQRSRPLRIAWSTTPLMGVPVDPEVAHAVEQTASLLAEMGHHVDESGPTFDGLQALRDMMNVWFFGFDLRLEGYAKRSGYAIGPDTRRRSRSRSTTCPRMTASEFSARSAARGAPSSCAHLHVV